MKHHHIKITLKRLIYYLHIFRLVCYLITLVFVDFYTLQLLHFRIMCIDMLYVIQYVYMRTSI